LFKNAAKGGENTDKQTLVIIGLVGGIIATVGVVLPWFSQSFFGVTVSANGIDSNQGKVLLLGGILALVGGIVVLAVKNAPSGMFLAFGDHNRKIFRKFFLNEIAGRGGGGGQKVAKWSVPTVRSS